MDTRVLPSTGKEQVIEYLASLPQEKFSLKLNFQAHLTEIDYLHNLNELLNKCNTLSQQYYTSPIKFVNSGKGIIAGKKSLLISDNHSQKVCLEGNQIEVLRMFIFAQNALGKIKEDITQEFTQLLATIIVENELEEDILLSVVDNAIEQQFDEIQGFAIQLQQTELMLKTLAQRNEIQFKAEIISNIEAI